MTASASLDDWLAGLGLGAYASKFAENDIDFSILPMLTDQNLKDLGVASVGHRVKLLQAIARLNVPMWPRRLGPRLRPIRRRQPEPPRQRRLRLPSAATSR